MNCRRRTYPSSQRRGGRDIKKDVAKPPFNGADGVVRAAKAEVTAELLFRLRPVGLALRATASARNKVASQPLFDRASTPPLRGGECFPHCDRDTRRS